MVDTSNELVEKKEKSVVASNFAVLATPEGIQKYILGYKKNGKERAVWDIVKDIKKPKKKKKKKGKNKNNYPSSVYDVYLSGGKKKKKKKKKNKYWNIQSF